MPTGAPGLAPAFAQLHREMSTLYSLIARRFELTSQQAELLCLLGADRPPSFGELAAMLGCDKTNVTGMVDRLERRGLLARKTDPSDRRVTRAVPTDQGSAVREKFRADLERELTRRLPDIDRTRLIALVTATATALAERR
ncbi:MarR family winged helix-turn-helix transcriptional regulator [Nocardia exalbida]|uniref:MarR family winged helix-turn-helix transcriptional regulator n=1 Tax=Nocardia exalbida TaxID=290231 RepID=UPI0002E57EA0|nr:MarR family transcriptional regulator [Nocardia exalbida]